MADGPKRIPRLGWAAVFVVTAFMVGLAWVQIKGLKHARPDAASPMPAIAQVPDFSFKNQRGEMVTLEDLKGRVWVADFVFTRCAGPCPLMSSQMAELQKEVEKTGGVRLVSVSVDPEFDTPEVLAKYGAQFGANPGVWWLLTGDKAEVDDFVIKGMLQPLARDGEGVPTHSQRFLVVDAQGRIRSYHSLGDEGLISKLLADIGTLMRESQNASPSAKP